MWCLPWLSLQRDVVLFSCNRFNNHSKQLTSSPFQHFGSIMLCIVILAGFYSWKLHKRTQYMWFSSAIFFGGRAFWYFPESKIPKMACSIVQYIVCTCIYCPWMIFKGSSRVFPKSSKATPSNTNHYRFFPVLPKRTGSLTNKISPFRDAGGDHHAPLRPPSSRSVEG